MIVSKALPVNPFWNFSVKIYHHTAVKDNLIALQNERGLNINILLFCIWYALMDQGRLAKADLKKILLTIQPWHDRIVLPLRRMRQSIKHSTKPLWSDIKNDIFSTELFSEQIEQLIILEAYIYKARPIRNNFQKIIDICKNIAAYCHILNVFLDTNDCLKVSAILGVVFSKIEQEVILRYCMEQLIDKEFHSVNLKAQLPLDL